MNSAAQEQPTIYLKAGEIYFSERAATVVTVLGSCLAVTLFHRRTGTGALCHALLPGCRERTWCRTECGEPGKYVECAIRSMLNRLRRQHIPPGEAEVKLFGGADMFNAVRGARGTILVGQLNISAAIRMLEKEGLRILAQDVAGTQGRKIFFDTRTGDVLLKRLLPRVVLADGGG